MVDDHLARDGLGTHGTELNGSGMGCDRLHRLGMDLRMMVLRLQGVLQRESSDTFNKGNRASVVSCVYSLGYHR